MKIKAVPEIKKRPVKQIVADVEKRTATSLTLCTVRDLEGYPTRISIQVPPSNSVYITFNRYTHPDHVVVTVEGYAWEVAPDTGDHYMQVVAEFVEAMVRHGYWGSSWGYEVRYQVENTPLNTPKARVVFDS